MQLTVGESGKRHAFLCDLRQYLRPFWKSDTIFNETVLLYSAGGAQAAGRLLYQPDRILSVRNYGLDTIFTRGVDYRMEGRTILRLAGSGMPWRADTSFSKKNLAWYNLQSQWVVVSYTHHDRWRGPVPAYSGDWLPRLMDKLRRGQPMTIVSYGMSITRGMDVSSYDGVAPYMPTYMELFVQGLRVRYPRAAIRFYNAGPGGIWGAVRSIIRSVRVGQPGVELILISNMKFDPDYVADSDANKVFYTGNLAGIIRNCGSGKGRVL